MHRIWSHWSRSGHFALLTDLEFILVQTDGFIIRCQETLRKKFSFRFSGGFCASSSISSFKWMLLLQDVNEHLFRMSKLNFQNYILKIKSSMNAWLFWGKLHTFFCIDICYVYVTVHYLTFQAANASWCSTVRLVQIIQ